jgi:NAD(P)-dependent dehydrogenase (short-subunit alcohol dehydrogenase family)
MKLRGKGIVITGANQGLGKEIARHCVDAGASVLLAARNSELLEATSQELAARAGDGQQIVSCRADVSRPDDVRAMFELASARLGSVDGLVNNAGVYGPMGTTEDVDWDQWVDAISINLMGTVLTCREALPRFRRQGRGKIVNLSGGGATAPLPRFSAYACSKAAVVRLTETLAEETKGSGIDVNAVAPGALNTRLLDEVLEAGAAKVGQEFYDRAKKQQSSGGAPLDKGAALTVFLLSSESDGISGRLLSAVWDPWPTLASRRAELAASDIYTLRRIVPGDRGKDWDSK